MFFIGILIYRDGVLEMIYDTFGMMQMVIFAKKLIFTTAEFTRFTQLAHLTWHLLLPIKQKAF